MATTQTDQGIPAPPGAGSGSGDTVPEARSARPRRGPGRVVAVIAATLVVLALAELGVRAAEPNLATPPTWGDRFVSRKAELVIARDEPVDVLFAGSSIMNAAVDPALFLEASDEFDSGFNGALPGATVQVNADGYLSEVALGELCPAVVVIGVTPRDYNDRYDAPAGYLARYLESPSRHRYLGTEDRWEAADGWVAERSALFRQRQNLREPFAAAAVLAGRPLDHWSDVRIDENGWYAGFAGKRYRPDPSSTRRKAETAFADYSVGGVESASLVELIERSRAVGAVPVVVELPTVESDIVAALPRGEQDLQAFRDDVAEVVEETGTPFVDATDLVSGPSSFADLYHLNGTGTAELSSGLAPLVEAALADQPVERDPSLRCGGTR